MIIYYFEKYLDCEIRGLWAQQLSRGRVDVDFAIFFSKMVGALDVCIYTKPQWTTHWGGPLNLVITFSQMAMLLRTCTLLWCS